MFNYYEIGSFRGSASLVGSFVSREVRSIRVAMLAEGESIKGGGAQVSIAHMVDGFKNEGWRVSLNYTTLESGGPRFIEALHLFGLDMTPDEFSESTRPDGTFSTYRHYLYYRGLMKGVKNSDIVIRALGYPWLSAMSRAPYVLYVQDPWQARTRHFLDHKAFALNPNSIYLLPLRRSLLESGKNAIFVANSLYVKRLTDEAWGASSAVIPPPVDVAKFLPLSIRNKKRNKIVSIGRFSPEKNQLQQVEIAHALDKAGVDFRLVIIGSSFNQESKRLQSEILERVKELGLGGRVKVIANASADEKIAELSDSSVFLHTCATEGFGIAVVEGMSAGCIPCVVRAGGPVELVPPEITFGGSGEAVEILSKLISGWQPLDKEQLAQVSKYDIPKFRERWIDFVKEKVS